MQGKLKVVLLIVLILANLVAAGAVAVLCYQRPYENAASHFPEETAVILQERGDGSVQISWTPGIESQNYLFEVLDPKRQAVGPEGTEPPAEYTCYIYGKSSHVLGDFPADQERTIRIRTFMEYEIPFEDSPRIRLGENAIEVTGCFGPPQTRQIQWLPDPDKDQVKVLMVLDPNCTARLYEVDHTGRAVMTDLYTDGEMMLSFGPGQRWPMPARNQQYRFAFDVYRQGNGYVQYGVIGQMLTLVREELLGLDPDLQCTDNGNNTFTFTWQETKGDYYEFQRRTSAEGEWETIFVVDADGARSYTTECLKPFSWQAYRVVACRNQSMPQGEPVAWSREIPVQMGATVVYSTIWPIQNLTVYSDPQRSQTLGTAGKGTAFCVLGHTEGMFRIRWDNTEGYIDSNYCMINLPELLGDLCLYDITNSYASLFKIHEYDLPDVTGEVLEGYERVQMYDNSFLVPLLYPTALKLEQAAHAAAQEGYQLKIYDSFRPKDTTKAVYELAYEFSQENIPLEYLSEEYLEYRAEKYEEQPEMILPMPEEETQPPEEEIQPPDPDDPQLPESAITYEMYITDDGRYALNYFLAETTSRHNMGVAMDMTLVKDGLEPEMQTPIHDLSWYSEIEENTDEADILNRIMKAAGFGGLVSEWWHFQDNTATNNLKPSALWQGVTPECWMADPNGWRYRTADGSYLRDTTKNIGGIEYIFDEDGYVKSENQN